MLEPLIQHANELLSRHVKSSNILIPDKLKERNYLTFIFHGAYFRGLTDEALLAEVGQTQWLFHLFIRLFIPNSVTGLQNAVFTFVCSALTICSF